MKVYRGRYQLGQEIPLGVLCLDASGTPTAPASAPTIDLYTASNGKPVAGKAIPAADRFFSVGLFSYRLFLGPTYAAGRYTVVYRYTLGSYQGVQVDQFDIVPGATPDGNVISMVFFRRPQADFVVMQLDSGRLVKGRNPSV